MKTNLFFALLLIPFFSFSQKGFTVKATFKGLGNKKVRVLHLVEGKFKYDTIVSAGNDLVVWKGRVEEPELVRMEVLDTSLQLRIGKAVSSPPPMMFLLDNANVTIQGDAKEAFAASLKTKNKEMIMYEKYRQLDIQNMRETWEVQTEMHRKTLSKDTAGNGLLSAKLGQLRKQNQQNRMKYIDANPASFASILMLTNLFLVMSIDDLFKRYDSLDPIYKQSNAAKSLYSKLESNRRTAAGKPMIEIVQPGADGNMVNSKNLRGKYILVDFWGSWCVPCRRSHPGLKDLYAKYQSKGLEIIGVSNEMASGNRPKQQQEELWRTAIKEDGINWLHVLYDPAIADLVKEYDINGYPTKFLIDREGKFLMRILGTSDAGHLALEKKLAELMPD